jgi:hypothetical protein
MLPLLLCTDTYMFVAIRDPRFIPEGQNKVYIYTGIYTKKKKKRPRRVHHREPAGAVLLYFRQVRTQAEGKREDRFLLAHVTRRQPSDPHQEEIKTWGGEEEINCWLDRRVAQ